MQLAGHKTGEFARILRTIHADEATEVWQMSQVLKTREVLTLDEAADYLRLPKKTIERQAQQGQIPGRRIEDTWRFLKAALDDWLRSHDGRALLLQQAGALKHDKTLSQVRAAAYKQRGRPEMDTRSDT